MVKKKILIVDDDERLREIYAAVFREEGTFDVFTAIDGQEAWELLEKGSIPDVVFTGILMPRMTGFELMQKMKQDPRFAKIPVAISSHRGRPEDKEEAEKIGAADFIVKGIMMTPADVVHRIKAIVGVRNTFRIACRADRLDGNNLITLLNAQQGTHCVTPPTNEVTLEVETKTEKGEFTIKLIC